jgi:hypothetical protein
MNNDTPSATPRSKHCDKLNHSHIISKYERETLTNLTSAITNETNGNQIKEVYILL